MMNQKKRLLQKNRPARFFSALLLLAIFLLVQDAMAQSQNTAHTLKLDNLENMPAATIDDVGWIAGHFRGEALGGIAEEAWTPPFGETMMGMFKLLRADTIAFYEFATIVEEKKSLNLKLKHFNADLTGWEEKNEPQVFPLVKLEKDLVFFDGITFRKLDRNTSQVFVAVRQQDHTEQELEFRYHRVKCGGVSTENQPSKKSHRDKPNTETNQTRIKETEKTIKEKKMYK